MYRLRKVQTCLIFIVVTTIFLFCANLFLQGQSDPFYTDTGGWDSLRVPLIKPYYLVSLDKGASWSMRLHANPPSESTYYYLTIHDIRQLAVANNIIMLYTPYVEHNIDQSVGQKVLHWFVISPESNIEEGFGNEDEFLNYIFQLGIQRLDWLVPNEVFEHYSRTYCLDWIPNCN